MTFEELLLSNTIEQEALINLLEKKGLISKQELLEEIKRLKSQQGYKIIDGQTGERERELIEDLDRMTMTFDKNAFVDIDNTLWQFCDAFYEELRKINKDFPSTENWTHWDIWQGYCSQEEFFGAVNAIHLRQDSDVFQPYPEAKGFLSTLRQNGYRITIASHRSPEFMPQTVGWLRKHGLVYDDIHLSYHKVELINSKTTVVVDDAPQVLEKAVEHKAMATGLLFPWNMAYQNNGFKLCCNLDEILEGILKHE